MAAPNMLCSAPRGLQPRALPCCPHPTPSQHPHSRSSGPTPPRTCTPKLTRGSHPGLPEQAGWVGQPQYQRVKPLPSHGILPSCLSQAPCQLPGVNTSWGGRGGIKLLSGLGGLLGGGLPTPRHPALPDGGSQPPTREGKCTGGTEQATSPPRPGRGGRWGAQPHWDTDPDGDF